ncbi:pyrroloquinoline quinone biosynthesis protein PqqE [Chromatiales bacterium (ex Bugula neritina AB1)]|nr:pyrroloquinoline quinone biosynthesis protein PqqE [Chromatiales bacterium (ex Bugula neritina AB1)]
MSDVSTPMWLLAELTYKCPLQCPYCSNPVDFANTTGAELDTEHWIRILREARELGAAQLGLSGGEPIVRKDLEIIVREAHKLGFYTNLITSGIGMSADRVAGLKEAGLDHIQVSFQASSSELNNWIAGTDSFEHKLEMARAVKANGFPMVLCFVTHRENIDQVDDILELSTRLEADYVELATTQYYGWAFINRDVLMPTREQLESAEACITRFRDEKKNDAMKIFYVVPDYFETRPKPCMSGWGSLFMLVTPDGTTLPCHSARQLPGIEFPNAKDMSMSDIWKRSDAFQKFRGFDWMQEPCRSCSEKEKDFGGCRCQAFMLTGDAAATDPVCDKSPNRHLVDAAIKQSAATTRDTKPMIFRNPKNSKKFFVETS